MRELASEVLELLESEQDFALIRLVAEKGSAPRGPGAEMVLRRDGSIAGTIGGGLLEATMMGFGRQALEEKRSLVASVDLGGGDVDSAERMICGGAVDALVAYVPAGDADLLEICHAIERATRSRRQGWLFTVFREGHDDVAPTRCLLDDAGRMVGSQACDAATLLAVAESRPNQGSAFLPDDHHVLVEEIKTPSTVIICGAGHVGLALAAAAAAVGFSIVVLDDREEFADVARFPGATVVHDAFDTVLSRIDVDQESYVVIATRGHTFDKVVLEQTLQTPARYIGLMASTTKRRRLFAALREEGFTDRDLARVHSPVGLEIRAETPAELAVSIVAELIMVRAGASR